MAEVTKAVNLTKDEIQMIIEHHGMHIQVDNAHERIERINYLYKRLKTFEEVEIIKQDREPTPATTGWGNPS